VSATQGDDEQQTEFFTLNLQDSVVFIAVFGCLCFDSGIHMLLAVGWSERIVSSWLQHKLIMQTILI
jgi:hypothetical protein